MRLFRSKQWYQSTPQAYGGFSISAWWVEKSIAPKLAIKKPDKQQVHNFSWPPWNAEVTGQPHCPGFRAELLQVTELRLEAVGTREECPSWAACFCTAERGRSHCGRRCGERPRFSCRYYLHETHWCLRKRWGVSSLASSTTGGTEKLHLQKELEIPPNTSAHPSMCFRGFVHFTRIAKLINTRLLIIDHYSCRTPGRAEGFPHWPFFLSLTHVGFILLFFLPLGSVTITCFFFSSISMKTKGIGFCEALF